MAKTANRKGQADEVIEFVKSDTELASDVNKKYAVIKEAERPKHLPSDIVKKMKTEGYRSFGMHDHATLWKSQDAKNPSKGFGVQVSKAWYWYDNWVEAVLRHCKANAAKYGKATA